MHRVFGSEPIKHPLTSIARVDTSNANIIRIAKTGGQAESTVHMLNWAIRSVKFLGVEFDQSEDEEVSVSDTTHL